MEQQSGLGSCSAGSGDGTAVRTKFLLCRLWRWSNSWDWVPAVWVLEMERQSGLGSCSAGSGDGATVRARLMTRSLPSSVDNLKNEVGISQETKSPDGVG